MAAVAFGDRMDRLVAKFKENELKDTVILKGPVYMPHFNKVVRLDRSDINIDLSKIGIGEAKSSREPSIKIETESKESTVKS